MSTSDSGYLRFPTIQGETFVRQLCAVGDRVRFNLYPGKGHLSVIEPSMPDTLAWMADRLAGQAAPTSC